MCNENGVTTILASDFEEDFCFVNYCPECESRVTNIDEPKPGYTIWCGDCGAKLEVI